MLCVQNATIQRLIMRRDKPEVQIKQPRFFIHVSSVNTNGIKIE